MAENDCIICNKWKDGGEREDQLIEMTSKGIETLKSYCRKRKATELLNALLESESTTDVRVKVHQKCRRNFTDPKRLKVTEKFQTSPKKAKLRSSTSFNWKESCFICTNDAVPDSRHLDRSNVQIARTLQIRSTVLQRCNERSDKLAIDVRGRLSGCIDLIAAEAVYHRSCYQKFLRESGSKRFVGRPVDQNLLNAFEKVCQWLEEESEMEVLTLNELHDKMIEFSNGEDTYSKKWLKKKLLDRYGTHLHFSEIDGHPNVLCFSNMVTYIINRKWYENKKADVDNEAYRIVRTAARLIREEIRQMQFNNTFYPTANSIRESTKENRWTPDLLHLLISSLVPNATKQSSIGQSIVKAMRPRSAIPPILFGLAVEVDHIFGSRWMIDELERLGFSVSYSEVTRFKQSVLSHQNIDELEVNSYPETFTQFVADNVDHNLATLDGFGSFHGMGIVAVSTSQAGYESITQNKKITREKYVKSKALILNKGIPIEMYINPAKPALSSLILKPFKHVKDATSFTTSDLDIIWQTSWLFSDAKKPSTSWSGYMQHVSEGNFPGVSTVTFLPIIDLQSSDMNCIYSTLLFIEQQAAALNIPTPCITFDQPLWLKSVEIVKSKSMNVVCRLGGFHLLMSFLGSIGKLMESSGLSELFQTIYGSNTVQHMLTGKAYARSLRAHFLVHTALNILLMRFITTNFKFNNENGENIFDENLIAEEQLTDMLEIDKCIDLNDLEQIQLIADMLKEGERSDFNEYPVINKIRSALENCKRSLANGSRTAKLWIQYMHYIDIIKDFIRAERIGNWKEHLNTVSKMLNLFAATGHINYARSARLYLQLMRELPEKHPWLHDQFEKGFHTVRRSDRYWAGLWTDLVIEQALMRTLKSRGGLSRGRGMSEAVRLLWVHSSHKCAEIHEAMTDITNIKHQTSEQHVELRPSRKLRDHKDLLIILQWLLSYHPFMPADPNLRSLHSGLSSIDGSGDVNCDNVEVIGETIRQKLDGKTFSEAKFKKADYVKTMINLQKGVKIAEEVIHIDASGLFSRLLAVAGRSVSIEPYFEFELTQEPTSIFKDNMMRKPNKANLKKILTKCADNLEAMPEGKVVVDGGALLHQIRWKKNTSYNDIMDQYRRYLEIKYGKCTVVFDGYELSTKDHEHQRRSKTSSAYIQINPIMIAYTDSQMFLAHDKNKSQFIQLLSDYLESFLFEVFQSKSDADTLIVKQAIESATSGHPTTVIADDTDILVLLLHHFREHMADIYLHSEASKRSKDGSTILSIRNLININDPFVIQNLLFAHAWSGCDTTSAVFGQGKGVIVKKLQESEEIRTISRTFYNENASHVEVAQAGLELFVLMYGGKDDNTLSNLRYTSYMNLLATSKSQVKPERLPPTENAAENHSYRVHLQVVQWKTLMDSDISPLNWGWRFKNDAFIPISSTKQPAPSELLNVIRCNCKLSSKNPCSTNICSCKKNSLPCMAACGNCCGSNCQNSQQTNTNTDESSSDEEDFERNIFDLFE